MSPIMARSGKILVRSAAAALATDCNVYQLVPCGMKVCPDCMDGDVDKTPSAVSVVLSGFNASSCTGCIPATNAGMALSNLSLALDGTYELEQTITGNGCMFSCGGQGDAGTCGTWSAMFWPLSPPSPGNPCSGPGAVAITGRFYLLYYIHGCNPGNPNATLEIRGIGFADDESFELYWVMEQGELYANELCPRTCDLQTTFDFVNSNPCQFTIGGGSPLQGTLIPNAGGHAVVTSLGASLRCPGGAAIYTHTDLHAYVGKTVVIDGMCFLVYEAWPYGHDDGAVVIEAGPFGDCYDCCHNIHQP